MTKFLIGLLLYIPALYLSFTINVRDYGAKGNGKSDDTKSFQKAINVLSKKGGGVLMVPSGNYPITFLKFFGKEYSNITILGNNANILQSLVGKRKSFDNNKFQTFAERFAADGCFVFDAEVSNQKDDQNSIKNIKISGLNFITDVEKNGFDELLHQISAHGVSDFIIENCTFTGFLGDGIAINGATDFSAFRNAYNKDVTIRNCKFDGLNKNNRQAISIYYSDGFLIDRCSFKNTTREDMPGAIDIEPDSEINVSQNGTVSNCTFENIGGNAAIVIHTRAPAAINNFSFGEYLIENCRFNKINTALAVIGLTNYSLGHDRKKQKVIFRNSQINNCNTPFRLVQADHILIENNSFKVHNLPIKRSVIARTCNNVTILNCNFVNIHSISQLIIDGNVNEMLISNCKFAGRTIQESWRKQIKSSDKFKNIDTYFFWIFKYNIYFILIIIIIFGLIVVRFKRKKKDKNV